MVLVELKFRRKQYGCNHSKTVLNENTRLLECQICNLHVDAFDWLCQWAHKKQNFEWGIKEASDLMHEKRKELEEVTRQLTNAKARLKRQVANEKKE